MPRNPKKKKGSKKSKASKTAGGPSPLQHEPAKPLLPPILLTKEKIFAAEEFVRDIDTAYTQVQRSIFRTQEKQKREADKHRSQLDLKLGQYVMLKFNKVRLKKIVGKGKVVKLSNRFYGPFKIIEEVNDVTFRLELPSHWRIHNAFHVSLLRPYVGPPLVKEDSPEVEDVEEILQPEQIIHHTERQLKSGVLHQKYLVKFKNYTPLDAK
ncbi:hypothetical protein L7F22_001883 [Adiantum nelumboides]|nr:hypothetical protein [Adiantum nelumboides]